MAPLENR